MSESGKVRVVRCPKCEKLLPELPDYPFYRCGGCNATLQATKQVPATTEVSAGGEVGRILENSECFSEKKGIASNAISGNDRESEDLEFKGKDRVLPERMTNSDGSSSSRTEDREVHYDRGNSCRRASKAPIDSNSDEFMGTNADDNGEARSQMENASRFHKSRQMTEWRAAERGRPFRRTPKAAVEGLRFSPYPDEGPSNCHAASRYGYGEQIKHPSADGSVRVECHEQDRAELLRKLDELRDQLSRSCNVSEEQKVRAPANRRAASLNSYDVHSSWFAEESATINRPSSQLLPPENRRSSYFGNDHVPLMNRHDMGVHNSYPPMHVQNEIPGYTDQIGSQVLRRAPHQPCQYVPRPTNAYLSGQYMEIDSDPLIPYSQNGFYNQPPCSCLHCYNKQWQVPAQVPPAVFCNRRSPNDATNHMFHQIDGPGNLGFGSYNQRCANAPLRSHEPQSLRMQSFVRRPSNLESNVGGFRRSGVPRAVPTRGNRRRCLPITGGAPFITCYNCFELLQLPKSLLSGEKSQQTLRCGACSNVISFALDGKRIIVSFPPPIKHQSTDLDNDSDDVARKGPYAHIDKGTTTYSSDFDGSDYNIRTLDAMPISSSALPVTINNEMGKECLLNLSDSEKMRGLSSSSSSFEDDESPYSMVSQHNRSKSMDLPSKPDMTSPTSGVPLREHFGSSPNNQAVHKCQTGSRSKRSDQATKGTSRQNSLKDASVATEINCSFNEYTNSAVSQDFGEGNKEDRLRFSKGESFFAGLIKRSFKDFGRSNQSSDNGKSNVSINNQPISDRLVKKAEKLAGLIQPGQYWYDYRAGFWGVMGQQCLGIIPPFIEEFNYPIPKNCSGGDTGVFVNGRELHEKDLDLLAGRGLPVTRDKSYIIEISGRVWDEASGEELDCLGKLAPTVEKVKHGFGMCIPKTT